MSCVDTSCMYVNCMYVCINIYCVHIMHETNGRLNREVFLCIHITMQHCTCSLSVATSFHE